MHGKRSTTLGYVSSDVLDPLGKTDPSIGSLFIDRPCSKGVAAVVVDTLMGNSGGL